MPGSSGCTMKPVCTLVVLRPTDAASYPYDVCFTSSETSWVVKCADFDELSMNSDHVFTETETMITR